jgi:hypothetical protein
MAAKTVTLMTTHRLAPGHDFTLVFEQAFACCSGSQRKHALSVNQRTPDDNSSHNWPFARNLHFR